MTTTDNSTDGQPCYAFDFSAYSPERAARVTPGHYLATVEDYELQPWPWAEPTPKITDLRLTLWFVVWCRPEGPSDFNGSVLLDRFSVTTEVAARRTAAFLDAVAQPLGLLLPVPMAGTLVHIVADDDRVMPGGFEQSRIIEYRRPTAADRTTYQRTHPGPRVR